MPLGLIMRIGRAFRRKSTSSLDVLTSKRSPRGNDKGKNCKPTGIDTRKGDDNGRDLGAIEWIAAFETEANINMNRTVKTTDKSAASSGHSDGSSKDNLSTIGSGGGGGGGDRSRLLWLIDQRGSSDGSLQQESDYPSTATTLWSNSSSNRKGWFQANTGGTNGFRSSFFPSQQNFIRHIRECDSSFPKSYQASNMDYKNPSLEFTLDRPDWGKISLF